MAFLGGIIHGAIEGAGESGGNRQVSTFEFGAQLHAQNMAALRQRRAANQAAYDRANRINAENARIAEEQAAQQRAFYNSPAQVERRRQFAIEQLAEESRERSRHEAHLEEMRAMDEKSAKEWAESELISAQNDAARDARQAAEDKAKSLAVKKMWEDARKAIEAENAANPEAAEARRLQVRAEMKASKDRHRRSFSNRFKKFLSKIGFSGVSYVR